MDVFTVRSLSTNTQRRNGARRARSDRELRVECATWKSLKTIGKRCVFSVHHRCIGLTQTWTVLRRRTWVHVWNVQNNMGFHEKTDQKACDMRAVNDTR